MLETGGYTNSDGGSYTIDFSDKESRQVTPNAAQCLDVTSLKRSGRTGDNVPRNNRGSAPYFDDSFLHQGSSYGDTRAISLADGYDYCQPPSSVYSNATDLPRFGSLAKIPSSNQLHYTKYVRPRNTGNRPNNPSAPAPYRGSCGCCCENSKRTARAESILSLSDDPETPEGLSWRRLHMSRAKLKATATTSELLSGFAMVAMVELQINKPTAVPEWLFVTFAVCTTVLVSVHIFALMISTYLLPSIDAVSKLHVSSLVTESPHDRMKTFIELAWAFSTILGLLLFLIEIAILCWVKFWDYSFTAAMSATMIVIPVLIVFVAFAMHFYHSLVAIKCKTSVSDIEQLEVIRKQLDIAP